MRSLWTVCAVAGVLALGLVADRCLERSGMPAELEGARRIWWPEELRGPVAFWAVRDFDLDAEQLEAGARSARLIVLGDPEVLVHWNGLLVHSSRYRVGQPAQVLEVGGLLRSRNRVVLEGRSGTGAGGLVAALWLDLPSGDDPGTGPVWVTDGSWLATDRHDPDLLQGFEPLSMAGDPAAGAGGLREVATWDLLGLGRWQPLRVADRHLPPSWPSRRLERTRGMPSEHEGEPMVEGDTPPWPSGTVYSFDGPISGCLALSGPAVFRRRAFFVDDAAVFEELRGPVEWARETGVGPASPEDWVLPVPGADSWLDAAPRLFGAVLLAGYQRQPAGRGPSATADGARREAGAWVQPCASRAKPRPTQRLLARSESPFGAGRG